MFEPNLPLTIIFVSICKCIDSLTVFVPIHPLAIISVAIYIFVDARAMLFIILPLTLINIAIGVCINISYYGCIDILCTSHFGQLITYISKLISQIYENLAWLYLNYIAISYNLSFQDLIDCNSFINIKSQTLHNQNVEGQYIAI